MSNTLSATGCIEFARELDAHPRQLSDHAQRHAERCAVCRGRLHAQLQRERELERTLHSELPEALSDRILLQHRLQPPAPRWGRRLAAGLLLALTGWAAHGLHQRQQLEPMLDELVAHAQQESTLFSMRGTVDESLLRSSLAAAAIGLPADANIRWVKPCRALGVAGIDIVIDTAAGVVVLTLLPDRRLQRFAQRATVTAQGADLHVALLPAPHGALALAAHNAVALDWVQAMIVVGGVGAKV